MHSPGVCGVILASGSQLGAGDTLLKPTAESVGKLIDALNADTELVLVAVGADAEALGIVLQDVLNRGRDTALVTGAETQGLTQETVHRMVAEYCAAGDEIWAVVPEAEVLQGHPVLLGRRMIELFLRGQKWSAANEILAANLEHVRTMKPVDPMATTNSGTAWKAPWD